MTHLPKALLLSLSLLTFGAEAENVIRTKAPVSAASDWLRLSPLTGEWAPFGDPYNCTEWKPSPAIIALGEAFKQTASCLQSQRREVSQRIQDKSSGNIIVESTQTETKTDAVSKTQDSVGTRKPTTLSLVTTNLPAVTPYKAFQPTLDWSSNAWADGGNDTFDGFGNFSINSAMVPIDGRSGNKFSVTIGTDAVVYSGESKWLSGNTFAFTVSSDRNYEFQISMSGNLGSDSATRFYNKQIFVFGITNPITVWFSNDGPLDDMEGDPQIWYAMVPIDIVTNSSSPTYTVQNNTDAVRFTSGVSRKGFIVFIGWGYIQSSQILNFIRNSLTLK